MKRFLKYLKQSLTTHKAYDNVVVTIWTNDLNNAQRVWEGVYMNDGWDIDEPIKVKWNWKRLEYQYRFKVKRI